MFTTVDERRRRDFFFTSVKRGVSPDIGIGEDIIRGPNTYAGFLARIKIHPPSLPQRSVINTHKLPLLLPLHPEDTALGRAPRTGYADEAGSSVVP